VALDLGLGSAGNNSRALLTSGSSRLRTQEQESGLTIKRGPILFGSDRPRRNRGPETPDLGLRVLKAIESSAQQLPMPGQSLDEIYF